MAVLKETWKQTLAKDTGKEGPCLVLAVMQTGVAVVETSVEASQKLEIEL